MAARDNECDQLEAAKQLLDVTRKYSSLLEMNNNLTRTQLELGRQIMSHTKCVEESSTTTTESLADALENLEKINDTSLDNISDKLDEVAEKGEKSRGVLSSLGSVLKGLLVGAASIASWAVGKLWDTLKLAGGIVSTAIGAVFDIIGAVWDLGKAILSIPFAAYSWLIGKANDLMSGGGSAYAEAIRALKTEYGALDQVAPSTIMKISRETQSISKHGLSAFRIWGSLGERMKALTELAQKMGPTFENFAQEFDETGLQIPALLKGLGLTDEQFKILGDRAKTMGTRFQDELVDMHKQSWALGGAFGHSTKLLNRDMAKAMGDVKRFGGATTAQLGQSALHARSLGLELEKVAGILDAFETFESAADVASKFAQSFGVQIEAFDMLNAQDTATIIDHMRQKFAEAGQDASTFNRAQLDVLTQGSKLAPEVAKQVFSLKNQGRSLEEIQKESEKAQNTFGNLDTALHDLRKSIEYLVMSGSMPKGGFLDMFLAGIERGINLNPHTRGLFRDIAKSLRLTYYDARSVFDGFVEYFPGVKDAINGLREVFNPVKLGTLIRGINDEIIKFFRLFSKGQMTFGELIDNLSQRFKDYLGAASSGGSKFLDGLGAFGRAVAELAGQIIEWLGSALADGIRGIADFIRNPDDLINSGKSIAQGAAEVGESLWEPMWRGIKAAVAEIKPALGELFTALLDEIPMLKEFMKLFDTVIYKSKKIVDYVKTIGADGKEIYTPKIDETETGEQTTQIFASIREFWDEIKIKFDDFVNNPGGFFQKFLGVLSTLEPVIKGLIVGVAALAGVGLARMARGALGWIGKSVSGVAAAGATAISVGGPAYLAWDWMTPDSSAGTIETDQSKPAKDVINVKADGNVKVESSSNQAAISTDMTQFDRSVENLKNISLIEDQDIKKVLGQFGSELEKIQAELSQNQGKIDNNRKINLEKTIDEQEKRLIALRQQAMTGELPFDQKIFDEALGKLDKAREAGGLSPSSNISRSAATKQREPEKKILPEVAVNTLKTMTFGETSEALQMLTNELNGKSSFKGLVKALSKADKEINANDGIKSAQNVALFFQNVDTVAASLGNMQRLVDIVGANGVTNADIIARNIELLENLFSRIVSNESISKLVSHVNKLSGQLPPSDLTQKVRDFFEKIEEIANRLKVLSASDTAGGIDSAKVGNAIQTVSDSLLALQEKLAPLGIRINDLSGELNKTIGGKGSNDTASSLMTKISSTLSTFAKDFGIVSSSLKTISNLESEFTADGENGPKIDSKKIKSAIGKMSESIKGLSAALIGGGEEQFVPPLKDPVKQDNFQDALDQFVDKDKKALKPEFKDLIGAKGKLTIFKDFISEVAGKIGSDGETGTISGSLTSFANFSDSLKINKDKFNSIDFGPFSQFLTKISKDIPTSSEVDLTRLKFLSESFDVDEFDTHLGRIQSSLETSDRIAKLIKNAGISDEELKKAIVETAAFTGIQAINPPAAQIGITLDVKVSLKADDIESLILTMSRSEVRKGIEDAAKSSAPPAAGAPPSPK